MSINAFVYKYKPFSSLLLHVERSLFRIATIKGLNNARILQLNRMHVDWMTRFSCVNDFLSEEQYLS